MDEPFSGLDEVHINKVIAILHKLKEKRTIIIIDKENNNLTFNGVINLY